MDRLRVHVHEASYEFFVHHSPMIHTCLDSELSYSHGTQYLAYISHLVVGVDVFPSRSNRSLLPSHAGVTNNQTKRTFSTMKPAESMTFLLSMQNQTHDIPLTDESWSYSMRQRPHSSVDRPHIIWNHNFHASAIALPCPTTCRGVEAASDASPEHKRTPPQTPLAKPAVKPPTNASSSPPTAPGSTPTAANNTRNPTSPAT